MEKQKKKVAIPPDGYEYVRVKDPLLSGKNNPDGGFIRPNKIGATDYQFHNVKTVRTKKLHTYEGRRCIFVDMPVFEVER